MKTEEKDKMRILFVFGGLEWLGIEHLSAALKKAGHETDLAFEMDIGGTFYFKSKKSSHKSILGKIKKFSPDIILFSSTTNLFPWVKEVAAEIKKHHNIPILVGGIHATILPEAVLSDKNIDIVCRGEGDEAIVELMDKIARGENYHNTRNFWFKKGSKIIKNDLRPLIEDLDSLPFPDKDMFYNYGCFRSRVYVMASRGCPYQCTYCFNHQLQKAYKGKGGNYVRKRTVDSIIAELKLYKKKYHIKTVHFYDDTFILDKKWIMQFSMKYKKEINLPFYCLVRANLVTNDIIKALKHAGCACVGMGIESGNDYIRNKVLKRNMSTEQIISAAKIIRQNAIKLVTFNIFGFPGETPKQMLDTMKINLKIRPNSLFTYIFYPFYGTDLMRQSFDEGLIDKETLENIKEGHGNYQSQSLLNHPYKEVAHNMKTILPLLNKMPRFLHKYIMKRWVFKNHSNFLLTLIKIFSIPFYSSWESFERLKEQASMFKSYYLQKFRNL